MRFILSAALIVVVTSSGRAADFPRFEPEQIDPRVGNVCYAVTTADVNGDNKVDVVAVTEDAVVWFENPSWRKHEVIRGRTARDNVCLQARDIDGDGRVDFALGAGWQPSNTGKASTLQWLGRDKDGTWQLHSIAYEEPTLHRLRWGDVLGAGGSQLVVAPLQGKGTKGPNWGEGAGVRVQVLRVPADPTTSAWPSELADDSLHTIHNLQIVDVDGDGRDEILLAAWEGVFVLSRAADGRWSKTRLGTGNQASSPSKGSSEIKLGRLKGGRRYIATVEPWHGFQVVVYTSPLKPGGLWERQVIDEPVQWGHAVWCDDLDGDGDQEIVIGQRDPNAQPNRGIRGPGVWVYAPEPSSGKLEFTKKIIDDGGVAVEDLVTADLNGDGRPDIIAGGRATHNVKIYWNRAAK
jgi:FG-GAP-like repeat